jgi:hypothetical protein
MSFPCASANPQEEIEDLEQQLYVQVNVLAEDEDGQEFHWTARLRLQEPLLPLRAQWAEAHGVSETAVGFEDFRDTDVDLQQTPAELGWNSRNTVHLRAIPLDPNFAERSAVPSVPLAVPASKVQPPKRARTETPEAASTGVATSNVAAGKSSVSPAASPLPNTSLSVGASPPTATPAAGSACGEDDEPIEFDLTNPKRAGTGAHERYEKYKKAKTRREAIRLGASLADIKHDLKKGFARERRG